jgi:nicotinate-nucleotide adenylyltransferase
MRIGLFFGSFNPVHIGHLALANYFVEFTELQKIWFVISPHNPLKKKKSLLNDQMRLEMVEIAIEGDKRFEICDIEFRMPQPSYTIDTLTYLAEKNPKTEFIVIMGDDGLEHFHKWKNYQEIIKQYKRLVYPRNKNKTIDYSRHENIEVLSNAPLIEISSSFIRKALKDGKDIRYFLPDKVQAYIDKYNLYKT